MKTSPTQSLFLAILPIVSTSCRPDEEDSGRKGGFFTEEGVGCMEVEADSECPAPADVRPEALSGSCGSTTVEVTGPGEYQDNIASWYYDTGSGVPGCCYPILETRPTCVYGRPLKVDGAARLAEAVRSDTWSARLVPGHVPASVRAELARRWTRAAFDEHASVAAFARVTMELLRFGAPPRLIDRTLQAGREEVRHAELGFAVASAFAGAPVGPGAYPIDTIPMATDLAEFAAETALEGCIGEGLASLLARAGASQAEDPVLRGVLETIATEEAEHALLAWQTVRWAIDAGGPPVREAVAAVFAHAAASGVAVPESPEEDLSRWGLLGRVDAEALGRQALREVVLPAAAILLGAVPPRSTRPTA